MKYLKWHLVDAKTGANTNGFMTENGLTHPAIAGLDAKVSEGIYFYGTCPDASNIPAGAPVTVLTLAQMNAELSPIFMSRKDSLKSQLWQLAKAKREKYSGNEYHPTEISAGIIKKQQADLAIAAATEADAITAAPSLALEASTRGMAVKTLAGKVVAKYNAFTNLESVIAGYSGVLGDQISALTYNTALNFENFANLNIDINAGWPV